MHSAAFGLTGRPPARRTITLSHLTDHAEAQPDGLMARKF